MGRTSAKTEKAREVVIYDQFGRPNNPVPEGKRPFSVPVFKEGWQSRLFYRTSLEAMRLQVLNDMSAMLNTFMFGPADYLSAWATAEMPNLTFAGNGDKKAETIVREMLSRVKYEKLRADFIYNGVFREEFIYVDIDYEPWFLGYLGMGLIERIIEGIKEGAKIGSIRGLKHLPPEWTYKWFNAADEPINNTRAYFQSKDRFFGQVDENPPVNSVFIPNINMIHPRWNHLRHANVWYSRPAGVSNREQFNRVQLMLEDSVLDSHFSLNSFLTFFINTAGKESGADEEQIKKFKKGILGENNENEESVLAAGSMFFLSGTDDVRTISDDRLYSIRAQDSQIQIDLLFLNTLFPAALAGYSGGQKHTGESLDVIKKHGELIMGRVNKFEWWEMLRPLIELELFLNGIVGMDIQAKFPQTSFDSRSVEEKIRASRVDQFTMSRQSAFEGAAADTWEAEQKRIIEEHNAFRDAGIDVISYREDTTAQDMDKGTKGSPGDGKVTPVSKQEGFSDDRKERKNQKQE
ncbi:MAG: hypothetical protein JW885_02875 [Deltaproteobacteria bacterium]|nr:hypothetical protein [Candidatus Zymogenaceae bacterium]